MMIEKDIGRENFMSKITSANKRVKLKLTLIQRIFVKKGFCRTQYATMDVSRRFGCKSFKKKR